MTRLRGLLGAALLMALAMPAAATERGARWDARDLSDLGRWAALAPRDALPRPDRGALDRARRSGSTQAVDTAADELALRLARMHLVGNATQAARNTWHIADPDHDIPLEPLLAVALADNTLDTFFTLMRPLQADYAALRSAYAAETDAARRTTLARNMERWRWMPRALGEDYVLVNVPRFDARLVRGGEAAGTWRVIVGALRTPTPVFDTVIEGVVLNPWWEIPASIVRESVGALVRNNPATARARGYVVQNGRYRQRPGPNNALGQMKLVMPNSYSVFMHDTPNRQLFDEDVRAFSHGCIRTGDAIGFAATLLEGTATRDEVDAILASGETRTMAVARPLPVYIAYFTAAADDTGAVVYFDDLYGRDVRMGQVPLTLDGAAYQNSGLRHLFAAAPALGQEAAEPAEIEC